MALKKITQLEKINTVKDTDLFIVETESGTKSIEKKDIAPALPLNIVYDDNYVHTDNNYSNAEAGKVALINTNGDGNKYLSDDGTYKEVKSSEEYSLPTASTTTLGGVKIGDGLSVDANGILSADATEYTLPAASDTILGGVKIGDGLKILNGVVSADLMTSEEATTLIDTLFPS